MTMAKAADRRHDVRVPTKIRTLQQAQLGNGRHFPVGAIRNSSSQQHPQFDVGRQCPAEFGRSVTLNGMSLWTALAMKIDYSNVAFPQHTGPRPL